MAKRTRRNGLATAATAGSLAGILEREDRERCAEGPTAEREQHGRVVRSVEQVLDAHGMIANPFRGETMLERMERLGDIGPAEREAGELFQDLFNLAHLDPLQAADMMRESRSARPGDSNSIERAKDKINAAMAALGGEGRQLGACIWYVVGCEKTIAEWVRREAWGGHEMSPHTAKGLLVGGLCVLAQHFGI